MPAQPTSPDFFLDGKKKSDRVWNATDAKGAQIIIASGYDGLGDAVFGFSTEAQFEAWLATKPVTAHEYSKGKAIFDRTPKRLTEEAEKELSEYQANAIKKYAADFEALLSQARIPRQDPNALTDFVTNYNPLKGPNIHSALLYDGTDFSGSWIYLPKGWSYNKLSWFNFNDKCSSIKVIGGGAVLCEHTNFGGRKVPILGYPAREVRNLADGPYYFDNMTSSVWTW